ncbi:uncharacterized protein BT62DRAFT_1009060 [Guyanagaster necrorhizus]|uniref:Uncharacterized protein n=1 Tax=Guyanagaster necrorhizus TaxID=856835 RepID=A0A9P7VPM6_9AGAR|nr:uncharacterized protein BT62DRAFT_1009060 [Guyanagaster necrorhizus MCA 3950]KAG7443699.1 hypothetical protein BT62DRAFT_1009060 [Guyanagaster necrorhizus MCA 3950]
MFGRYVVTFDMSEAACGSIVYICLIAFRCMSHRVIFIVHPYMSSADGRSTYFFRDDIEHHPLVVEPSAALQIRRFRMGCISPILLVSFIPSVLGSRDS